MLYAVTTCTRASGSVPAGNSRFARSVCVEAERLATEHIQHMEAFVRTQAEELRLAEVATERLRREMAEMRTMYEVKMSDHEMIAMVNTREEVEIAWRGRLSKD